MREMGVVKKGLFVQVVCEQCTQDQICPALMSHLFTQNALIKIEAEDSQPLKDMS